MILIMDCFINISVWLWHDFRFIIADEWLLAVWLAKYSVLRMSFLYLNCTWRYKHIKLSLIIQVGAGKLVSCVFNAKYCLSSACTISFYSLLVCDFALLPDTQKIRGESFMKPFWFVTSSHVCHSHVPGGRCREYNPMIWPNDTVSISLTQSCGKGKSTDTPSRKKHVNGHRLRWE